MDTVTMLLQVYKTPRMRLSEVCNALGMSVKTGYTYRSKGIDKFPVNMSGSPLTADVRDVAAYLDVLRNKDLV